ncbi:MULTISPECIES: enoyl-CoA hydratase-related protein [unclassified Leifsonia]|uniref:enoyl-CoA hydratase/isomerase family protein n=1 Tax=unclassified Leifsonia TaxID=2663824 RepID=UPI0008A7EF99|nr:MULTISPECIES: enoyl-CoA hydratase-related protein [unclassified Leifsonia]SEI12516.1 Enoyl-CoA hydratase/carnithine racemase [Leifsonia sp. CL154]SFL97437.1 Enoyl-CoA hydratase/carnithine racemase [Leifsonia sp. CL147]
MIDLDIADGIARVTLNAPERLNALGPGDLRELTAAYAEAEASGVRALVLRGEGRAFCAGRDIAGVDPATDDVAGYLDGLVTPLLRRIAAFPAPTFAAAHGACLGVGLGLLAMTDVVYVAEDAKVGSPFAALGAALDSGGHWLLVSRLGPHRALDLVFSGRLLSGAEAVAAGLFSRALPASQLRDEVDAAATAAASGATEAFLASKRIVAGLRDGSLDLWGSVAAENAAQSRLRDTADYREGFRAFQEKRKPGFTGH